MKRILLTLLVGFCFGSVAVAQEPAKAGKVAKKALSTNLTAAEGKPATAEMIKAKQAEIKANAAGKVATPAAATASKAADLTSDRKN